MTKSSAQTPSGLEDQLRSMILSNVTISNDVAAPSSQQRSSNPASRGRGRGRGQHRGGHTQHLSDRLPQRINATQPPQPHVRGGSLEGPWRSTASGPPAVPLTPQASQQQHPWRRRVKNSTPEAHSQPDTSNVASNSAPYRAQVEPPRILQRPQGVSSSSVAPPAMQSYRPNLNSYNENVQAQCQYLDRVASIEVHQVEMTIDEQTEKETFRANIESLCQLALHEGYAGDIANIELRCFGSLSSGFATKGSDVDLAIVPSWKATSNIPRNGPRVIDRDVPRLLEKRLLDNGYGARLLTRTRVPILKVCELPAPELYANLCEERQKWDELSEEEKYPPPPTPGMPPAVNQHGQPSDKAHDNAIGKQVTHSKGVDNPPGRAARDPPEAPGSRNDTPKKENKNLLETTKLTDDKGTDSTVHPQQQRRFEGPWLREKALGPLDFPKSGVGIQSDINFENPLALHNTALLRCYCLCDPRIRPMVLFVKAWAKRRKINSSYSGTLSSYGYVLMVLHYLVNVAQPPVCPNLQLCWRPEHAHPDPPTALALTLINGYEVRFWRDENAIRADATQGRLTANRQPLGALLRGFFQYYASPGYGIRSFNWMGEVLSLRTPGGICTKQMKGWTGAKSTLMDGREVRHRYLFAIEDPFEWDHNVARTVTHYGIVAIRDEFRRAWRIIAAVGGGRVPEGELFEAVVEATPPVTPAPSQPASVVTITAEEDRENMKPVSDLGGW